MTKVYLFLANGFEEIEGLTVVDLLRRAEIGIEMISIEDSIYVTGSHNITIKADHLIQDVDLDSVDMLVLPGGMPGTIHLLHNMTLVEKVKKFHEEGKMLAAICAAPSVLGAYGVLNGKDAVCYPGFEEKLLGANVKQDSVVKDGNVITARGMGVANDFALKIIEHFMGEEKAKEVQESVLYKN